MLLLYHTTDVPSLRDGGFDMSRYTGPKARVSRRLATNIWGTKGEADALEKRPYPQANMAGLDVEEMHLNTKCSFKKNKSPLHLRFN
ncbi:MAG: hypothetical protein CM15mP49_18460 [Actinomycetota bacterium]|nr:MAG: hypothetical protein CM15mP49_18460 [Actinomycetota bacterium]